MLKYDAIVVGAGNSGLVAALKLQQMGKKVLILEKNNYVGGYDFSRMINSCEFEPSFQTLFKVKDDDSFSIKKLFKELKINEKIDFCKLKNIGKLIGYNKEEKVELVLPFGVENFINAIDNCVLGSKESLNRFFELAKECNAALNYLEAKGDTFNYDELNQKFPNFVKVSLYSVKEVLDSINMPLKTQGIINSFWFYFGSSESDMIFAHYADFIYQIVSCGLQVPKDNTYTISSTILKCFLRLGGRIIYNSNVLELLVENKKCVGVRCESRKYEADLIIYNGNELDVVKLVNKASCPSLLKKSVNVREYNLNNFDVHLILNRSVKDLNITEYNYFIYNSLNSDDEFININDVRRGNMIVTVPSVVKEGISREGTALITISTLIDANSIGYTNDNYYSLSQNIADSLINSFTNATGINIREYIEDIKIVTPLDNKLHNNGFRLSLEDNLIGRMLNRKNENYIHNLITCSGFNGDVYRECSSYYNSFIEFDKVGESNGKN